MRDDQDGPPDTSRHRLRNALVVSPLLIGNALMLALCLLGFYVLSATRAYVGGESHWSKGRALAVQQLRAYAATGEAARRQDFEAALAIPLGDREARLAMEREPPDLDLARAAFVRGGNSPADVAAMVRLYRWFGHTELMSASVAAWRRGDDYVFELQAISARLQQLYAAAPAARQAEIAPLAQRLDALEREVLAQERIFSQALGEASRSTFKLLAGFVGLTALLLTFSSYLVVRHALRRQARDEAALADANRRWRLAAESGELGLFEWQQDSDMVSLDARASATYGLGNDPNGQRTSRTTLRALSAPEDLEVVRSKFEQAARAGTVFRHRYRIRLADGGSRHVDITGAMRGSMADGTRSMVGIVKDVSAEVQQARLALEKAAAERSAAARMEFLSRLSHELRTPLNAVLGFSDLLLLDRADPLSPGQRPRVQMMADAGTHLLRLVDDVLDISSIDAGQFRLERKPTALAPVIAAAVALVSAEQLAHGAALQVQEIGPGLRVWADGQRLGQVLANLLSNACKYNRPGGRIELSVRREGLQWRIAIADQGHGLTPEEIALLFQPFKRLPGTAHLHGTGLGLTIVKLLVEQMGGRIEVSSEPGQGAVFSLLLDVASD